MLLEPCPFCGGEALVGQTLDASWYAMCVRDQCITIEKYWKTEAEASAAWNTRAPEPRIAALEAEVARLRLDVEAQEALQVSAYHAGLKAGWNFCVSEDNAGMQAAMTNTDHIKELRSIREARAALEARK